MKFGWQVFLKHRAIMITVTEMLQKLVRNKPEKLHILNKYKYTPLHLWY